MKTPLLAATLLFASVSLFALGGVVVTPGTTPPTTPSVPTVKPPCTKPTVVVPTTTKVPEKKETPKAPEKKEAPKAPEKKCDDDKRPFKK
jgi:hypothetical protein